MKRVGFIGLGSMNGMLARGFLSSGALCPGQTGICTRTMERTADLAFAYPGITRFDRNQDLAAWADLLIIGVRPLDLPGVLHEIRDVQGGDIHIVSLAACVRIAEMAAIHPGRISRIFPSLCATVQEAISLCTHQETVTGDEAAFIEELFSSVSQVVPVREEEFEVAGDLMSCGPALITRMLLEFAGAGARHSTLSPDICTRLVMATASGTVKLLRDGMPGDELISRVATPGGITAEGVSVLQARLPGVFDELMDRTLTHAGRLRDQVSARCAGLAEESRNDPA